MNVDEVLYACKESEKELVSINSNGQRDLGLNSMTRQASNCRWHGCTDSSPRYCDIEARRTRPHFLTIRSHLRKFASISKKNRPVVKRFVLLLCAATALCSVFGVSMAPHVCVCLGRNVCLLIYYDECNIVIVREGGNTHTTAQEIEIQRYRREREREMRVLGT